MLLRASGCEAIEGGARRRVLSCDFDGGGAKEKSDVLSIVIAGAIVRDAVWLVGEQELFAVVRKFASRIEETPPSESSVGSKESADRRISVAVRIELLVLECERKCAKVVKMLAYKSRVTEIWPESLTRRIAQRVIINVQDTPPMTNL